MLQSKEMDNVEIANLLRNVAAALQIQDKDDNKFKIIAYERAADAIEHLSSEAKDIYDEGKLEDIPGVGKSIAKHLSDIFEKGISKELDTLLSQIPSSVFELLPLDGIGPKLAYKLVTELKIESPNAISKLKVFAERGKIEKLEGFGIESQAGILKAIFDYKGNVKRHLLNYAEGISGMLIGWMKKDENTVSADTLGSLRRRASTVGDIDIAVASNNPDRSIEHFINYPDSKRTLEKGDRKASILIPGNIQVDLRAQEPDSYGALLQHFTGSKHHNIALREYALSLSPSLSLSEYGIRKISKQETVNSKQKTGFNKRITKIFRKEEEFYNYLGLEWIPPELREGGSEIQFSLEKKLPKIVDCTDIKGDLQIHSNFDIETSHDLGLSSYEEIVGKANALGYEYVAFTEHNPSRSKHTDAQIIDLLKRKRETVEKLNEAISNKPLEISSNRKTENSKQKTVIGIKRVFNSLEIDILSDGNLPVPENALETLDFALVSIHSNFRLNKVEMTKRIISALSHPVVLVLAHPTGRKLNERESIEADWERIFEYCINNKKLIEINGDPMRLDLPDHLVKTAVKMGVVFSLGTDSHHIDHMDNMRYAVDVARRGWAEKKNIVNTLTLTEIEEVIK